MKRKSGPRLSLITLRLANRYITHLTKEFVSACPNLSAVLYVRVSARTQDLRGNLRLAKSSLERRVEALGIPVIATFMEIGSGWRDDLEQRKAAASMALDRGAILVAESTDRFIRSREYHSKTNFAALPTEAEFEALRKATLGVRLATLVRPDADPRESHSYKTERGLIERKVKGGRPRMRKPGDLARRRQALGKEVYWMRNSLGLSWGKIYQATRVAVSTLRDWCKADKKLCGFPR